MGLSDVPNLFSLVQCVPRHLFIRLKVIQLSQPCRDLNDTDDKEAIRAVLSLHSGESLLHSESSKFTDDFTIYTY